MYTGEEFADDEGEVGVHTNTPPSDKEIEAQVQKTATRAKKEGSALIGEATKKGSKYASRTVSQATKAAGMATVEFLGPIGPMAGRIAAPVLSRATGKAVTYAGKTADKLMKKGVDKAATKATKTLKSATASTTKIESPTTTVTSEVDDSSCSYCGRECDSRCPDCGTPYCSEECADDGDDTQCESYLVGASFSKTDLDNLSKWYQKDFSTKDILTEITDPIVATIPDGQREFKWAQDRSSRMNPRTLMHEYIQAANKDGVKVFSISPEHLSLLARGTALAGTYESRIDPVVIKTEDDPVGVVLLLRSGSRPFSTGQQFINDHYDAFLSISSSPQKGSWINNKYIKKASAMAAKARNSQPQRKSRSRATKPSTSATSSSPSQSFWKRIPK